MGLQTTHPNQTANSIALTVMGVCTTLKHFNLFHDLFQKYATVTNYQSYIDVGYIL